MKEMRAGITCGTASSTSRALATHGDTPHCAGRQEKGHVTSFWWSTRLSTRPPPPTTSPGAPRSVARDHRAGFEIAVLDIGADALHFGARAASTADSLLRIWPRAVEIAASCAATWACAAASAAGGAIHGFGLVIELLLRDEGLLAQIGEALARRCAAANFGLTLHHQGLHGGLLALALGQLAACRTHRIYRLPGAGFSLSQLRLQRFSVHAHQH